VLSDHQHYKKKGKPYDPDQHHSRLERSQLPDGLVRTQRAQLPAHPAGAIELPEPTLHAAQPTYGFRVKSGLRAEGLGAPSFDPRLC
jgi:mersacidin/lichenicidin family type 2 lantibiotic